MHAKEFLDGFSGSSLIHVARFKFACRMPGRDCGVGGLELLDFVRLLVHDAKVLSGMGGVNGAGKRVAASVSEWTFLRLAYAHRYGERPKL